MMMKRDEQNVWMNPFRQQRETTAPTNSESQVSQVASSSAESKYTEEQLNLLSDIGQIQHGLYRFQQKHNEIFQKLKQVVS